MARKRSTTSKKRLWPKWVPKDWRHQIFNTVIGRVIPIALTAAGIFLAIPGRVAVELARSTYDSVTGPGAGSTMVAATPAVTEPRTGEIVEPEDGATVSGLTRISARASDDVGVVGVQFQLEGSDISQSAYSGPTLDELAQTFGALSLPAQLSLRPDTGSEFPDPASVSRFLASIDAGALSDQLERTALDTGLEPLPLEICNLLSTKSGLVLGTGNPEGRVRADDGATYLSEIGTFIKTGCTSDIGWVLQPPLKILLDGKSSGS